MVYAVSSKIGYEGCRFAGAEAMIFLTMFVLGCLSDGVNVIQTPAAQAAPIYSPQFVALPEGGVDQHSPYSHILVRDAINRRSLYFVRDSGDVVLESSVDMKNPDELVVPYTQVMMAAQLCQPKANSALMIGVGGGGMLHYLQAYFPTMIVDAVDIDPMIINIAERYFSLKPSDSLRLHVADGFQFIAESKAQYDIVFMDAFLKPAVDTDPTGTHLRLKTLTFYESIKARLTLSGVVAFNINPHPTVQTDIDTIRAAFDQVWVIPVPDRGNTIVLASVAKKTLTNADFIAAAQSLDGQLKTSLSYSRLASLISDEAP